MTTVFYWTVGFLAVAAIVDPATDWLADKFAIVKRFRAACRGPVWKKRLAHRLYASAVGDEARDAAVAKAMAKTLVLEGE